MTEEIIYLNCTMGSDLKEAEAYYLDHHGVCSRGGDCWNGKNENGHFDGCLKVGWKGRTCPHWQPLGALSYQDLINTNKVKN